MGRWWPWIIGGVLVGLALVGGVFVSRELIKRFEGLRLSVYQDEKGLWTVGYGHLIGPNDGLYPYTDVTEITEAQADAWLVQDTAEADAIIKKYVRVPLSKNQREALLSFVYNIGEDQFAASTMLRKLNAGDYEGAAAEFDKWVHAGGHVSNGLVARREQEKELFLTA